MVSCTCKHYVLMPKNVYWLLQKHNRLSQESCDDSTFVSLDVMYFGTQQSKRMLRKRRRKGNKLHDFSLIGEIKSLKGKKDCLAKSTFCHQNEHFFFWNDLRRHPKNHSGEKSSNCNHCDFACTWANSLRKFWKLTRKKEQNLLSTSPGLNSSINISWAIQEYKL